jgi:uncharacterized protein
MTAIATLSKIRNILSSPPTNSLTRTCDGAGFRPDGSLEPAGETEIVSISLYEASVGTFVPYLGNLSALLDHGSAYAKARNIDPTVLLNMRLYPNMYSLRQQVGEANRHAVIACALLAGREPHSFGDAEPDITELKSRIAATIDFVQGMPRGEIDGAADKEVAFRFRNGSERKFTGRSLLLTFSVPQFFFHVTTAYDILRHAGVDLAKKDFLGPPRQA